MEDHYKRLREEDGIESGGEEESDDEAAWEGWDVESDSSESEEGWIDVESDGDDDLDISDSEDESDKKSKAKGKKKAEEDEDEDEDVEMAPEVKEPARVSSLATTKVRFDSLQNPHTLTPLYRFLLLPTSLCSTSSD